MTDTSPITSREFDSAIEHVNRRLDDIVTIVQRIESNSVTTARYTSGMNRVKDLERLMRAQDAEVDVVKTSVLLLGQTVETYRKFVWVMIGAVVSLAGSLVGWLIMK